MDIYTDPQLGDTVQMTDYNHISEVYNVMHDTDLHTDIQIGTHDELITDMNVDDIDFEEEIIETPNENQEDIDYAKGFMIDTYVSEVLPPTLDDITSQLPGNLPAELIDAYEIDNGFQIESQKIDNNSTGSTETTSSNLSTIDRQFKYDVVVINKSNIEKRTSGICKAFSNPISKSKKQSKHCAKGRRSYNIDMLMDQLIGTSS